MKTSPRYLRPYELSHLGGNPSKIMRTLGWRSQVGLDELIDEMIHGIAEEQASKRYEAVG